MAISVLPGSPGSISSTDSQVALPTFEALAPTRKPTAPEPETNIRIEHLEQVIRLKVDAGPGCGGIAWPAGEVLSRYLAYRKSINIQTLKDKTIVELGSGTGLVGIVAALLDRSTRVTVTDQSILLDLMQANVALNDAANVDVKELNWGDEILPSAGYGQVDMVLAADCVYFEPAFPLLVKTLCDLAPVGIPLEILFCWKKRRKADKRFFQMLKKHFDSHPVEDDRPGEKEKYGRGGVSLIRLTRRK